MEGDESDRQPAFKVQDRRRFSSSGDARDGTADDERSDASASSAAAPRVADPDPAHALDAGGEIKFETFVLSLSTQALVHLGEIPDPVGGTTDIQLEGARQIIDILALLAEKTRGNLDPHEAALLDSALYDLRMRYVERSRHR